MKMKKYLLLGLIMLFLVSCTREEIDIYVDWTTIPNVSGYISTVIIISSCSSVPYLTKCSNRYTIANSDYVNSHHGKTTTRINYFYLQGKLKGTVKLSLKGKPCGGGQIESDGISPVEFMFECKPTP